VELHLKMRQALPPGLRHQLEAMRLLASNRFGRQWQLVFPSAEKIAGPEWKTVRVAELDQTAQVRVANLAALCGLSPWWQSNFGHPDQLPPWLLGPERGTLRLSGPIGRGTLYFDMPTADGKMTAWAVGTSAPELVGK
jgi:hypothetical protein